MRSLMAGALLVFAFVGWRRTDDYGVELTRASQDLYRDGRSGLFIETQVCYEYVYGEQATLHWSGTAIGSTILFHLGMGGGTTCDVVRLLQEVKGP